uniref:Olfactory receptor n=1 Tax=Gouania willdenowi TaxID=441366 RepID=A0A8C5E5H5_GOUWI
MVNRTLTFTMTAYSAMDSYKHGMLCVFLLLYVTILVALLIGVIYSERSLHAPMYVLLCNLAVNGLYGSSALLPHMLSTMLSTYEVSVWACQTQVYAIHTYAIVEFTILAVMSYDRYVAICHPLTYSSVMAHRLGGLVACMWLYPLVAFVVVLAFTIQLSYCGRSIEKLYCLNYLLVRLSCTDTGVLNVVGLVSVVVYTVPQLIMIFYSYAHILRVCVLSFRNSRFKALRTCTPHLLSILNYSFGCFFEIAQGRFDSSHMTYHTKMFMSLYFLICPPLLNPLIYGLGIQVVRLVMS